MKRSKLKRRLRKKNRLGEFQEFGFQLEVKFKPNLKEAESVKFYDEFIDLIEANDLLYGGGNNLESLHGFLTASEKYQSPTEQQREKIKKWLENRSEIAECEVGNLKDAWYD